MRTLRREAVLALGAAAGRAGPISSRPALERLIALMPGTPTPDEPRPVEPEHVVQAVGRMASVRGASGDAARSLLVNTLRVDERPAVRANAAVALGIAVRLAESDAAGATMVLRNRFTSTEEPQERAAYALSLGLVGDHESVPGLRALVADAEADGSVRGYAAMALGLLGSGEAEILGLLDAGVGLEARVHAHLALGVLGGDRARAAALALFEPTTPGGRQYRDESHFVVGAAAWSLGANADMDTIARLVEVAEHDTSFAPDVVRALAATAVGRACARPDVPMLDDVLEAVPQRVLTPAFNELLTIL